MAVRVWPGMSGECAQEIAATWSGEHYVTDVQADQWWTVGKLDSGGALLASVLRENGIGPEHMRVVVRNETIPSRLRNGMATEQLAGSCGDDQAFVEQPALHLPETLFGGITGGGRARGRHARRRSLRRACTMAPASPSSRPCCPTG